MHPFEFDEEKQHIYNDTEIDFNEDNFEDFDEKEAAIQGDILQQMQIQDKLYEVIFI
jgi:hypothetical protein